MWGAIAKFALPMIADVIGDRIAFNRGKKGAQDQNAANRKQAQDQMAFQREMATSAQAFSERMSNTAYQRKVEDLRAAGLNPALAYESGGASSPVGTTAGGASAHMENVVSSGLQASQLRQTMKLAADAMHNQTEATKAEIKQKTAAAGVSEAERKRIEQQTEFERIRQPHDLRLLELEKILSELSVTGAENQQQLEEWLKGVGGMSGAKAGGTGAAAIARAAARFIQLMKPPGKGITINKAK